LAPFAASWTFRAIPACGALFFDRRGDAHRKLTDLPMTFPMERIAPTASDVEAWIAPICAEISSVAWRFRRQCFDLEATKPQSRDRRRRRGGLDRGVQSEQVVCRPISRMSSTNAAYRFVPSTATDAWIGR